MPSSVPVQSWELSQIVRIILYRVTEVKGNAAQKYGREEPRRVQILRHFLLVISALFTQCDLGVLEHIRRATTRAGWRMRTLERHLLVMIEPVREQRMIGGHRHLHRLDDMFETIDAFKNLAHGVQAIAIRRD